MTATVPKIAPSTTRRPSLKQVDLFPKPADESPQTESVVEVALPITELEYLTSKNPALATLIEALDLQEVNMPKFIIEGQPMPAPVEDGANLRSPTSAQLSPPPVTAGPVNIRKLEEIAVKSLPTGSSYTETEAIACIQSATNVPYDRAQKGFVLMVEHGVLAVTSHQTYFLTNSVPF